MNSHDQHHHVRLLILSIMAIFISYGLVIVFVLVITTEPFLASILPTAVEYAPIVMDCKAKTLPLKEV